MPQVGLKPNRPQKPAGIRIEPPPSVATCSHPMPSAAATAAPPLLPPGVRSVFQGLRVTPVSGLSVTPFQPNSGVVVLPRNTAPCSRSRATVAPSSSHFWFGSIVREPRSVGQPFARIRSFTVVGNAVDAPCRRAALPACLGFACSLAAPNHGRARRRRCRSGSARRSAAAPRSAPRPETGVWRGSARSVGWPRERGCRPTTVAP